MARLAILTTTLHCYGGRFVRTCVVHGCDPVDRHCSTFAEHKLLTYMVLSMGLSPGFQKQVGLRVASSHAPMVM